MVNKLQDSVQSIVKNRRFIFLIISYLVIVYSLYFFLDVETMIKVSKEDGFIEYFTFFSFLGAFIFFVKAFLIRKNIFFLLFAVIFFVGAGEEISWGQRIFSFSTPDNLKEINVQHEFNIHNIEILNTHNFDHNKKTGLSVLFTINFLYRLFFIFFGVILPIIVIFNKNIALFAKQIQMPIPPLSIGMLFMVNWGMYKFTLIQLLHKGEPLNIGVVEVMESGSALIFFILSLFFYKNETQFKN